MIQEIRNEREYLDGNLNRMFVTDEKLEVEHQFYWSIRRLVSLRDMNIKRLEEKIK